MRLKQEPLALSIATEQNAHLFACQRQKVGIESNQKAECGMTYPAVIVFYINAVEMQYSANQPCGSTRSKSTSVAGDSLPG